MFSDYYFNHKEGEESMNQGIKVFLVLFSAFMIIYVLNVVDQLNTPIVGDWATITTNFINAMPYLFLIFLGIYQATRKG